MRMQCIPGRLSPRNAAWNRGYSEAIRVSLLKLPRLPGKLIACFPKTPPLKHMPTDGEYIIWKRRKYHLDCREVARGTHAERFFMLVYL